MLAKQRSEYYKEWSEWKMRSGKEYEIEQRLLIDEEFKKWFEERNKSRQDSGR